MGKAARLLKMVRYRQLFPEKRGVFTNLPEVWSNAKIKAKSSPVVNRQILPQSFLLH